MDLTVPTGTVLSLRGPDGAGKTIVVEILQGVCVVVAVASSC